MCSYPKKYHLKNIFYDQKGDSNGVLHGYPKETATQGLLFMMGIQIG